MNQRYPFKRDVSRSLCSQMELAVNVYTVSHHYLFRACEKKHYMLKEKDEVPLHKTDFHEKKQYVSVESNKHVSSPPCGARVSGPAISVFVVFYFLKPANGALTTQTLKKPIHRINCQCINFR